MNIYIYREREREAGGEITRRKEKARARTLQFLWTHFVFFFHFIVPPCPSPLFSLKNSFPLIFFPFFFSAEMSHLSRHFCQKILSNKYIRIAFGHNFSREYGQREKKKKKKKKKKSKAHIMAGLGGAQMQRAATFTRTNFASNKRSARKTKKISITRASSSRSLPSSDARQKSFNEGGNNNYSNKEEDDNLSMTLKKAFVATTASLVLAAADASQASVAAAPLDVTNKVSINGPARYLPSELTKPDPIFEKNFNVSFAGLKVDHKILVSTIIFGQAIGFAGAFVGGLEAKKRAEEITRLNKSLLEVNGKIKKELRREKQSKTPGMDMSIDPRDGDPYVEKILTLLRSGKAMLKLEESKEKLEEALGKFEEAHALIIAESGKQKLNVPWKAERKALKGIAAAASRLGYTAKSLEMTKKVLDLALVHKDMAEITDNYGKIADLYTELDQLESAHTYYDLYFNALDNEYGFSAERNTQAVAR